MIRCAWFIRLQLAFVSFFLCSGSYGKCSIQEPETIEPARKIGGANAQFYAKPKEEP